MESLREKLAYVVEVVLGKRNGKKNECSRRRGWRILQQLELIPHRFLLLSPCQQLWRGVQLETLLRVSS